MLVKTIVIVDKLIIALGSAAVTGIIGVIAKRLIVDSIDEAFSACVDRFKEKDQEQQARP